MVAKGDPPGGVRGDAVELRVLSSLSKNGYHPISSTFKDEDTTTDFRDTLAEIRSSNEEMRDPPADTGGNDGENILAGFDKRDPPTDLGDNVAESASLGFKEGYTGAPADIGDKLATKNVSSTSFKDADLGAITRQLMETGAKCRSLAQDTIEQCNSAETKGVAMGTLAEKLAFSLSLTSVGSIHNSISGEKLKWVKSLAQEAETIARNCIDNSVQMAEVMECGLKPLSDVYEGVVDRAAGVGVAQDDLPITDIEKAIDDVERAVERIQMSNLSTASTVGIQEIKNLPLRANVTKSAVLSIRALAEEVGNNMEIFSTSTENQFSILCRARDLRRSILSSNVMKKHAEQVVRLMKAIAQLCDETNARLTLAATKECIVGCVEHATTAKAFCVEAQDKGNTLLVTSLGITDDLMNLSKLNAYSILSLISLVWGDCIQDTIELATIMEDLVDSFTNEVIAMVDHISERCAHLPTAMTEEILENTETSDDDPRPANIQKDIKELNRLREVIEKADFTTARHEILEAFSTIWHKSKVCNDLLDTTAILTDKCIMTTHSFLHKWNLEETQTKIMKMCRIVSLGVMMRQFAAQAQSLLKALVALMDIIHAKFHYVTGADAIDDAFTAIDGAVYHSSIIINDWVDGTCNGKAN